MRNLRFSLATGVMSAVISSALGAWAADATDQDNGSLEEIVVTAWKREQTTQDLPGVISALSAERIKYLGISNLENLASEISGMTVYNFAGASFVTLRGVGVPVDTGVSDNNISITVDGVVLPRQTEAGIDSTDLQRVEVLRGPQGTLYGGNATGGAINYISAPPTETVTGAVSTNVGDYHTWGANGFVSGPITDGLLIRVSASHEERDEGYVRNIFTGGSVDKLNRSSLRAAVHADLNAHLKADLSVFWEHERFDAYQALMPPGPRVPNAPPQPFGSLAALGLVAGRDFTTQPFAIASNYNPASDKQTLLSVAKLKWDITHDISMTSLTGYVDHKFRSGLDGDGTSYNYSEIPALGAVARRQPSQSASEELTVSGAIPRRGSWLVGAYYFHEDVTFALPVIIGSQLSPVFNPGLLIGGGFTQVTESLALFADTTVPITDSLRVFAGARVSEEKLYGQALAQESNPHGIFRPAVVRILPVLFGLPPQNPTAISCAGTVFQTANTQPGFPNQPRFSQNHTPFTPRFGVQYDVTGNIMVYVQYSKGFKDGGHSTSNCANNFQPETLTSYEAGIKTQFFDRRLTFDTSVFHYDYHNMQIFKFAQTGVSTVENADAKIDGVDVRVEALLGEHFRVDVAATVLDDRFSHFCSTDPSWPTLAGPCPDGIGTGQDLRGRPLPNVSKYTINTGLDTFVPVGLGPFRRLTLRGEEHVVGPTQLDAYGNRPETRRPMYAMLDATATLATAPNDLQIRAFGRNLTDRAVVSHSIWTGTFNGEYLPPRTFGLEVSKRF